MAHQCAPSYVNLFVAFITLHAHAGHVHTSTHNVLYIDQSGQVRNHILVGKTFSLMATLTGNQQDRKERNRKKDTLGCADESGINLILNIE